MEKEMRLDINNYAIEIDSENNEVVLISHTKCECLHFPKEIFLEFINAFLEHGKQLEEKVN
jgi:hypothetical protein